MSEGLAKVWGFLEKMAPVQQHHIPHAPEKPVAKSIAPGRELLPGKLWEGWSAIWAIAENVAHVQQHHIPQTLKKPVANSIASSSQQLLVREPKIDLRDYQSLSAGILISSDVLKEKLLKKEITEEKAQELKNLKVLTDKCEALVFSPEKFEKFMEKDGSPKGPKIDKNDSKRVLADREDHSGNASGLSKSPKKDGKVYPEPLGSSPEVLSNDFDYCCKKATKLFAVAVGKDEKRSIAKDLRLFIDNHRASGVRLVLEAWSHASSGELKIAKAKAEEAYKDLASAAELQISLSKYLETASQVSQVTESETLRNLINELRQTKEFFMPENSSIKGKSTQKSKRYLNQALRAQYLE